MTADQLDFDRFYSAHFGALTVQLHAFCGDRTEAQDLAQEAFCRAWQRWSAVAGYDDPVAWVRRVGFRLAISRWRRLKVMWAFAGRQQEAHAPSPGPDHVALVTALRALPPVQRRAVVLFYLADQPVGVIAADEGVAEGTVRSWLHRGRTVLAEQLSDLEEVRGGD